jgi:hypothetical protein
MSDTPPAGRFSSDEILALRFAAHRQLARWSKKPTLGPRQRAQRAALKRAVAVLHDPAFADGCELLAPGRERGSDA